MLRPAGVPDFRSGALPAGLSPMSNKGESHCKNTMCEVS